MASNIHPSAEIAEGVEIPPDTRVWHHVQIREGARIGRQCILGKGVYVDRDVVIGDRCKVQNRASIYHGVTLSDGVFVGPHACFANDRYPRAINQDGTLKSEDDWEVGETHVGHGASIGAGAVVLPGVTIGEWAMIAAGSVVTSDVRPQAVVKGNPARFAGWACTCGRPLVMSESREWYCEHCDRVWRFE